MAFDSKNHALKCSFSKWFSVKAFLKRLDYEEMRAQGFGKITHYRLAIRRRITYKGIRDFQNMEPIMRGKCPHCLHDVHFENTSVRDLSYHGPTVNGSIEGRSDLETVKIDFLSCPNCRHLVVQSSVTVDGKTQERLVWPPTTLRLVPPEVPAHIKKDYLEATDVLQISPKASAALSRRCLQTVLTEAGKAKSKDLSKQIDEVLKNLPGHLSGSVDTIRAVGNFAAHPIKSKSSGEIVEVEPGEAEYNLDVLDGLFDFYYVQPERMKQKIAALNLKLKAAGKPPLK